MSNGKARAGPVSIDKASETEIVSATNPLAEHLFDSLLLMVLPIPNSILVSKADGYLLRET